MAKRYLSIWFGHLLTDWTIRRRAVFKDLPFVLATTERGRKIVRATSNLAQKSGIETGMVVADCRAIFPKLEVLDYMPGQEEKLLRALAEWLIRYSPIVAVDLPDGLILDISGCAHLWQGETNYLRDILLRLRGLGYHCKGAIADTIGAAWAAARFGKQSTIIGTSEQQTALAHFPPAALRLDDKLNDKMLKLGFQQIGNILSIQRSALRRRFGEVLLLRLDQALGHIGEALTPVSPIEPYQERLHCFDPIRTRPGLEIALQKVLEPLCTRLSKEAKGMRKAVFKGYRVDGNIQQIEIGTNKASYHAAHLFSLFNLKLGLIEPALGIELFVLEATVVEDTIAEQEMLWTEGGKYEQQQIAELLDRLSGKVGNAAIRRYLPAEHYWPERSYKVAGSLTEQPDTEWAMNRPRPLHLLHRPEPVEVTVPIPDYPPMLFIHKGVLHKVAKADGPDRIEQEWWLQSGEHRDYYTLEDEQGQRYWVFRSGHYDSMEPGWFLHGYFV